MAKCTASDAFLTAASHLLRCSQQLRVVASICVPRTRLCIADVQLSHPFSRKTCAREGEEKRFV